MKIWTGNVILLILQQNWIEQMLSFLRAGILSMLTPSNLSTMYSLAHILIMPMWLWLKILNRAFTPQERPWEILHISYDIAIQVLCLKKTIYLNLMIQFNLKMYFWSAITSIIYYHQPLTIVLHFVLIYTIIKQLPLLQAFYSSPHSELHYRKKNFHNYKLSQCLD